VHSAISYAIVRQLAGVCQPFHIAVACAPEKEKRKKKKFFLALLIGFV
jgi:hypothetical protein